MTIVVAAAPDGGVAVVCTEHVPNPHAKRSRCHTPLGTHGPGHLLALCQGVNAGAGLPTSPAATRHFESACYLCLQGKAGDLQEKASCGALTGEGHGGWMHPRQGIQGHEEGVASYGQ